MLTRQMLPTRRMAGVPSSLLVVLMLALATTGPALGWGASAHALAAEYAARRMTGPLGDLFRANRDLLVCYSILPDTWWGSPDLLPQLPAGLENPTGVNGSKELSQHFITVDGDVYRADHPGGDALVFPVMGRNEGRALCERYVAARGAGALESFLLEKPGWKGGLEELPEALFERLGQVPWAAADRLEDLTRELRARNWQRVLVLATVLGHYAADCHVPLHTARDHDGLFVSSPFLKGIHARWESRMVERYESLFRTYLEEHGRDRRIHEVDTGAGAVTGFLFRAVSESGSLIAPLMRSEEQATRAMASIPVPAGATPEEKESRLYDSAYHARLFIRQGHLAMDRLDATVEAIVHLWQVAWVRAGRPVPPSGLVCRMPLVYVDWKAKVVRRFDPRVGHHD